MGLSLLGRAQQDVQYSQYMFNGIYINPAYSGYKEQLNFHSFYRNQWTGIPGSPKSMSVAVDATANDGNVGLSMQITNDNLGAMSNLSAYANYAYRLRVGSDESSRLAFGLGIGFVQSGLEGRLLDPIDGGDQYIPTGKVTNLIPDAKAGIYYSDSRFYAGFSATNLISQFVAKTEDYGAFIPVPKAHFYLTAGMLLPLSEMVQIKPSILLKDDRGGPTSLDLNALFLLNGKVWIGGAYRTAVKLYKKNNLQDNLQQQNSVVGMIEVFASESLRIGYAYDQSISKLAGYSGGSHEISIGIYIKPKKVRMLTPRYF